MPGKLTSNSTALLLYPPSVRNTFGFWLNQVACYNIKYSQSYYKTTTYLCSVEIQEHINPNLFTAIASELHDLSDKTVETAYPLLFLVTMHCSLVTEDHILLYIDWESEMCTLN